MPSPVCHFDSLIISDLAEMASTGRLDRDVLLWIQECIVQQALGTEGIGARLLEERARHAIERVPVAEAITRALTNTVQAHRASCRKEGGEGDLQTYIEVARGYFAMMHARYEQRLGDLMFYLQQLGVLGMKPDIEVFARQAYVIFAKLSSIAEQLERLGDSRSGERVLPGIEAWLHQACGLPDRTLALSIVSNMERIAADPAACFSVSEDRADPVRGPWDVAPAAREDDLML
jgi:hypothetical protein